MPSSRPILSKGARHSACIDQVAGWLLTQLENLRSLATTPLVLGYLLTDQRDVIDADVARWAELLWVTDRSRMLPRLLYAFPEFRGVYYLRLATGNPRGALAGWMCQRIWKSVPGLDLCGSRIGPGLFVSHGQATVLSAESVGANCQVHQGVTVGWDYRSERRPIIGDDVFIGAGAKVLGAITVGDKAMIGANAVVVSDVPAGATAVGIPARIVPAGVGGDGNRTTESCSGGAC